MNHARKNKIKREIQKAVECGVSKLQRLKQKRLLITASLIRRGGASEWERVKNEARSLQSSDRTAQTVSAFVTLITAHFIK